MNAASEEEKLIFIRKTPLCYAMDEIMTHQSTNKMSEKYAQPKASLLQKLANYSPTAWRRWSSFNEFEKFIIALSILFVVAIPITLAASILAISIITFNYSFVKVLMLATRLLFPLILAMLYNEFRAIFTLDHLAIGGEIRRKFHLILLCCYAVSTIAFYNEILIILTFHGFWKSFCTDASAFLHESTFFWVVFRSFWLLKLIELAELCYEEPKYKMAYPGVSSFVMLNAAYSISRNTSIDSFLFSFVICAGGSVKYTLTVLDKGAESFKHFILLQRIQFFLSSLIALIVLAASSLGSIDIENESKCLSNQDLVEYHLIDNSIMLFLSILDRG